MSVHLLETIREQPSSALEFTIPWQCSWILHEPFLLIQRKKWNELGFRPPLCTYRLNWARRTSWGWWDDWDDTVLQTQDSKIRALAVWGRARYLSVTEAPHNTDFHTWMGKKHVFVSFKPPRPGTEPRTLAWKTVLTTTLRPPPCWFKELT